MLAPFEDLPSHHRAHTQHTFNVGFAGYLGIWVSGYLVDPQR